MNTSEYLLLCAFGAMLLLLSFSAIYIYCCVKNQKQSTLAVLSFICATLSASIAIIEKRIDIENYEMFWFFVILIMGCFVYHIFRHFKETKSGGKNDY